MVQWLAYFFRANLEGSRIIKQYKMHSTGVFTTTFKNANRNTWKANHMSPPSKHRSDPFLAGLCGSLSQVFVTNKDSTFRDGFGSAAPLLGRIVVFFSSLREPNFNQQQRESCAKAMFGLFFLIFKMVLLQFSHHVTFWLGKMVKNCLISHCVLYFCCKMDGSRFSC